MQAVLRLPLLLLAVLIAPCALAAEVEGGAADRGQVEAVAAEPVQAAVAAALVASLGERFDDPALELRLGPAEVDVEGPREYVVHGIGYLRFTATGDDWLAFHYQSRYDPVFGTAGFPEVTLGADGEAEGERFVPNDAALLGELEAQLTAEFESWPDAEDVFLRLDEISSLQSGSRYLRIEADGSAEFGSGGAISARVEALYDLEARAWLDIAHQLGPDVHADRDAAVAGP